LIQNAAPKRIATSTAGWVTYRRFVSDRTAPATAGSLPNARPVDWSALQTAILDWYEARGRRLPFRGSSDPYAILVSEAMAQQTHAERAGEAWVAFIGTYPTIAALAAATPADVLRAWQGLGYNRRALNLWRAARHVVDDHGGRVPSDVAVLMDLPGVGPYTARAVAAIAFGAPVGAVDTNVRRVLGRIVGGRRGIVTATELQRVADAVVPRDRPGAWTHALMDLGATVCGPRQPDCVACPAQAWCRYASEPQERVHESNGASANLRGSDPPAGRNGRPAPRFPTTSRWLRGRIVDQLRAIEPGAWLAVRAPIGVHGELAVATALEGLARDGLIELDGVDRDGDRRARLALT
jgi:A/G-specific adenine glycosylase